MSETINQNDYLDQGDKIIAATEEVRNKINKTLIKISSADFRLSQIPNDSMWESIKEESTKELQAYQEEENVLKSNLFALKGFIDLDFYNLYSNGGGDLDAATEWDLVCAAYELCTETRNVRFFAQHKYSGQKAFNQYIAKEREKNPAFNYVMSGEPGGVYRFEMTWNMVNPQIADILQSFNYETAGIPLFSGLNDSKIGDAGFKMYEPGRDECRCDGRGASP